VPAPTSLLPPWLVGNLSLFPYFLLLFSFIQAPFSERRHLYSQFLIVSSARLLWQFLLGKYEHASSIYLFPSSQSLSCSGLAAAAAAAFPCATFPPAQAATAGPDELGRALSQKVADPQSNIPLRGLSGLFCLCIPETVPVASNQHGYV
jgi:hypothetical protein